MDLDHDIAVVLDGLLERGLLSLDNLSMGRRRGTGEITFRFPMNESVYISITGAWDNKTEKGITAYQNIKKIFDGMDQYLPESCTAEDLASTLKKLKFKGGFLRRGKKAEYDYIRGSHGVGFTGARTGAGDDFSVWLIALPLNTASYVDAVTGRVYGDKGGAV